MEHNSEIQRCVVPTPHPLFLELYLFERVTRIKLSYLLVRSLDSSNSQELPPGLQMGGRGPHTWELEQKWGHKEGAPLWDFGSAGGGFPHCITTAALTLFKPLKILNMPVMVAQPTVHIFAYFQIMTGNCYPKSLLQIRRGRWGTRQKLVRRTRRIPHCFPTARVREWATPSPLLIQPSPTRA